MHQRVVGIRLVTGLIVAGGLLAASFTPVLAGPGQGVVDGMTVKARLAPCTGGADPTKCKPIEPEEPSKRGGRPKNEPRGGNITPPPSPPSQPPTFEPPRGGRIPEPERPDDDDSGPRVIVRSGDSEPFVAQHQSIPNVSDGVFMVPQANASNQVTYAPQPVTYAPQPVTYAPQPVTYAPVNLPVVVAPPDTGIGPEMVAEAGMAGALAVLGALFGAGALVIWRRPVGALGRD